MNTRDYVKPDEGWYMMVDDRATLQRGTACYQRKLIQLTDLIRDNESFTIRALARSSDGVNDYSEVIELDGDGEVLYARCDCPAYKKYEGLCKHLVGTMLAYTVYYDQKIAPRLKDENSFKYRGDETPYLSRRKRREAQERAEGERLLRAEQERQARIEARRTEDVLTQYQNLVVNDIKRGAADGDNARSVTLIPVLDLHDPSEGLYISFQIRARSQAERAADGTEAQYRRTDARLSASDYPRAYIVRNIRALMTGIMFGEFLEFGKELSFMASDDAFDETGRRWLGFLRKHYNDTGYVTDRYDSQKDKRLRLTNLALCELFDFFSDCVYIDGSNDRFYRRLLTATPPNVVVTVENGQAGGVTLVCEQAKNVYLGLKAPGRYEHNSYYSDEYLRRRVDSAEKREIAQAKHLYVIQDGELRRFPADASRALYPFMMALLDAGGALSFSPMQTDDLCARVIPAVSKYIQIADPLRLLKRHETDAMRGRILLDALSRDQVAATLYAEYRGIWIDMHSGKAVGQSAETGDAGAAVPVNWDVTGLDASGIRRDRHAEERFLASVGRALGFERESLLMLFARDESGAIPAGSPERPITVNGNDGIYQLLTDGIVKLKALGEVLVTDRMRKLTVEPPRMMTVGVSIDNGLMKLTVDSGGLALDELRDLLRAYHEKKRYYRLKDGAFVDFARDADGALNGVNELKSIEQGLQIDEKELLNGDVALPAFRALYLDGLFQEAKSLGCKKDRAFTALTDTIKRFARAEYPVPPSLKDVLRKYQTTGYQWLRSMEACSFCGILADDMGLGKSVQLISVLLAYYESGDGQAPDAPPSLIVCPSSLTLNWKNELKKFAPSLPVRIVQGALAGRKQSIQDIQPREIIVTSYDLIKRDQALYEGIRFHYFAIDEAQYIKNHTTQAAKAVKQIVCEQRFALTGTPIENRLSELWSIFDFLMPGYLYKYARFKEQFEQPIARDGDTVAKANLRRMIMPFVLRRLKTDVLTELPPKTTAVVPVELNEKQMEAYNAVLLTGLEALKSDENRPEGVAKMQVLALLTKLRRLCCDPTLCFDTFRYESSKLEACMELLSQAKEGGHRVLLFSQYTDMLDLIAKRIEREGLSYLRLQGSTLIKDRIGLVDAFNKGDTDVFLISLKAGGTGLNLTAADTVIHYDPWWNLAAQDQATDRAHRIGQDKPVQVYKLIAQNTIEEKILTLQERKKDLAQVIESDDGEGNLTSMSAEEIVALLKDR